MNPYCPTCLPGIELEESGGEFWCPVEERAVTAAPFPGSMTADQRDAITAGFAVAGIGEAEQLAVVRQWLLLPGLPGLGNLSWPEAGRVLERLERRVRGVGRL